MKTETKKSSTVALGAIACTVPLEQILRHKEMTYRPVDPLHVEGLAEDIGANGLLAPLIVFSPTKDARVKLKGVDGDFPAAYLAAGSNRLEALKSLRKTNKAAFDKQFPNGEIPCSKHIGDVKDMLLVSIRENVHRKDMSAEEIFPVLEKLANEPYNMMGKEIAKHVGKSTAWVSQHMAVNEEVDEEDKKAIHAGEVDVSDARKIAAESRKLKKNGASAESVKKHVKESVAKAKAKKAAKLTKGEQRASGEDRKVSAKKVYDRVKALKKLPTSRHIEVLTGAIAYLAGDNDKLPAELRVEPKVVKIEDKKPAKSDDKKAAKKSKK